jgi:hypothetical protein
LSSKTMSAAPRALHREDSRRSHDLIASALRARSYAFARRRFSRRFKSDLEFWMTLHSKRLSSFFSAFCFFIFI